MAIDDPNTVQSRKNMGNCYNFGGVGIGDRIGGLVDDWALDLQRMKQHRVVVMHQSLIRR